MIKLTYLNLLLNIKTLTQDSTQTQKHSKREHANIKFVKSTIKKLSNKTKSKTNTAFHGPKK